MKNIQVIDGAINCQYPLYAATDDEFEAIFPALGQDLELIEAFIARAGENRANVVMGAIWQRRVDKKTATGIHGTLFYDMADRQAHFPISMREADWQARTETSLRPGK